MEGKPNQQKQKKMTPAQVQRYCDLLALHRKKTGCNPDVNEIAKIAARARRTA
jgi:hypothetical protein